MWVRAELQSKREGHVLLFSEREGHVLTTAPQGATGMMVSQCKVSEKADVWGRHLRVIKLHFLIENATYHHSESVFLKLHLVIFACFSGCFCTPSLCLVTCVLSRKGSTHRLLYPQ